MEQLQEQLDQLLAQIPDADAIRERLENLVSVYRARDIARARLSTVSFRQACKILASFRGGAWSAAFRVSWESRRCAALAVSGVRGRARGCP